MSWNDPCMDCGEPRYACECKYEPPVINEKIIDKTGKFKVMEEIFFGGKACIAEHLTYEEAVKMAKGYNGDVYTSRYVLPNHIPSDLIYDYNERINIYS